MEEQLDNISIVSSEDTPNLLDALDIKAWEDGDIDPNDLDLKEEIIRLNRVAKVVKGGRRFSFAASVVVGNGRGIVGFGKGKARQVPDAISKAVENAKRNLFRVTRVGRTIPHKHMGEFGAARVLLRPASEGTGVIAGSAVRAVMDLAGVHDILTKSMGSSNVVNVVKAAIEGLRSLGNAEKVARLRGKRVEELVGKRYRKALHEQMRECMPRKKNDQEMSVSQMLAQREAAGREQMMDRSERPSRSNDRRDESDDE